jgi:hypothetical protein
MLLTSGNNIKGKANNTKIDANIAITPPNLSGTARKIA